MTLEEQIALMRQQAESKVLPFYIKQSLLAQISVLEQQRNVAASAAVEEKRPTLTLKKKKEA